MTDVGKELCLQTIVFLELVERALKLQAIAGELAARLEMMKSSIVRHRTDGALVRVSSPVYGGVQQTSDRLVGYIQALYPILSEYLPD